jgi:hypothetical protein
MDNLDGLKTFARDIAPPMIALSLVGFVWPHLTAIHAALLVSFVMVIDWAVNHG